MLQQLEIFAAQLNFSAEYLLILGIAIGSLLAVWGIGAQFVQGNAAAQRISAIGIGRREARLDRGLLKSPAGEPGAVMKAFIPADLSKRSELQRRLAQAGFAQPGALAKFTMVRIVLGLILPGFLLALIVISKTPGIVMPLGLSSAIGSLSNMQTFQFLSVLVGAGYFGPVYWLNGRVSERRRRIEEAFPNALDLMQISVESGLGFDAAMTRVGNELEQISPDIAFEFLSVQRQVQAGRDRNAAMQDMATRTGVETVGSFANVAQQSMQYGTSMAKALTTYSEELRKYREMRAQEMANKLPVKMSAVLASLMLPALILLTVGPVLIRYIRYFGG